MKLRWSSMMTIINHINNERSASLIFITITLLIGWYYHRRHTEFKKRVVCLTDVKVDCEVWMRSCPEDTVDGSFQSSPQGHRRWELPNDGMLFVYVLIL